MEIFDRNPGAVLAGDVHPLEVGCQEVGSIHFILSTEYVKPQKSVAETYIDVGVAKSRFGPLSFPRTMTLLHPGEENLVSHSWNVQAWRGNSNGWRRREGKIGNDMRTS